MYWKLNGFGMKASGWPVDNLRPGRKQHFIVFVCFLDRIGDAGMLPEVYVVPSPKVRALTYNAPGGRKVVQLSELRLDDLSLGRHAGLGDFTVTVAARGRKGFTLVANKDGNRLYTRITSGDGDAVGFFSPNITVSPDGTQRFDPSPLGAPVGAELIVAAALNRKDYPFTLVPNEDRDRSDHSRQAGRA